MSRESPLSLGSLVEDLVAESSREERERRLLELPIRLGVARAAALWRRLPPPPGFRSGGWRELRAVGPRQELPGHDEVVAACEGSGAGVGGARVLACDLHGAACALALGGAREADEDGLDLVEALLVAFAAIEDATGSSVHASSTRADGALLESVAAPLPSGRSPMRQLPAQLRHDVRHHLASIRTTQELLRRYGLDLTAEERTHFAELLDREVRRASGLVLQATAEGSASELRDHDGSQVACAAEVVRDVVRSELGAARQAGIALDLAIEPGCEHALACIGELDLERVLRNLLVNAREAIVASGRGARVGVALGAPGERLRLVVEDDGPGIPDDERERVLEPGYTRGKPDGSGLGLSIVHGLVEAWDGELTVGRGERGGARIEVLLSRAAPFGPGR